MNIYDYNGRKNICGEKIRMLRIKHHWSQNKLATELQLKGIIIGRDSINRIEKGTRFVADYEIKILAEVFDIPIYDLFNNK